VARDLLQSALNDGRVITLDWQVQGDKPQTKQAYTMLKQAGLVGVRVNVFLSPDDSKTAASFSNIPSVRVVYFDATNAYTLADARYWVILKNDVAVFKDMVSQWI
jgi:ribosomal protein L4